jgi:hypothetical protein
MQDDVVRELDKLTEMHAAGVLSNEQFEAAKARLVPPGPPAPTAGPAPVRPHPPAPAHQPDIDAWVRIGIAACGALTLLAFFAMPLATLPFFGGITGVEAASNASRLGASALGVLWLVPLAAGGVCAIGAWLRFSASVAASVARGAAITALLLAGLVVLLYVIIVIDVQSQLSEMGPGLQASATSFTGAGFWIALLGMLGAGTGAVVELVAFGKRPAPGQSH